MKNEERRKEENGLVLKRCVSTYKQEFLNMDKTNYLKQFSSTSEREINESRTYKTHENLENISSNVQNETNNLFTEKKNNKVNYAENHEIKSKFQNKKKRKLGNILFQSTVRRNFSPQILKTKIDFNLNYFGKNPPTTKNSQNLIKTNISSNANEDNYLINNGSSKNIITEIHSLNNTINQNADFKRIKSQSPIRKISDIDSNTTLKKKDSELIGKNIFNGSNLISYKSNSPTKSKISSNLKRSENIMSKKLIEEINDKNINPVSPSLQIGINKNLGKNFSSNNIFLNSQYKNKYSYNNLTMTKNTGNLNKNNKAQPQSENYKFLFSPKKYIKYSCIPKLSNLNEITTSNTSKNTYSNPNLRFCNNRYKINYTTKSYADIKNKEANNEKQITQKVSNFKVNIKEIKSKFSELNNNNNLKKISNVNNNSRNFQRDNEILQSQNILLSSCNYTTEDFKKNLKEINDSTSKYMKEKLGRERSPKSPRLKTNSYANSHLCNNMLITNQGVLGNFQKYSNNNLNNKHLKKSSHLNYNFSNNFKLDLSNKKVTYNKLGNITKNSNFRNSMSLKGDNIYLKESSYNLKLDYNSKKYNRKNKSENNLIEVAVLKKEMNKKDRETNLEINVESAGNASIILDCINEHDLLDSKEYDTKVSSNVAISVNQILTRTTKDDTIHHIIKNNNIENSAKTSNINGPEDLHFFYVNIFQKKRNYAPKFDY